MVGSIETGTNELFSETIVDGLRFYFRERCDSIAAGRLKYDKCNIATDRSRILTPVPRDPKTDINFTS